MEQYHELKAIAASRKILFQYNGHELTSYKEEEEEDSRTAIEYNCEEC